MYRFLKKTHNTCIPLFAGNHCVRESTLSIVSSECSRPLSGVTIYSRNYMAIVSSSNGRYRIRICSLPLYVTLKKYGFRTRRVIVRYSTEKFTMRCLGMFMVVWFYLVNLLALFHVVLLIYAFSAILTLYLKYVFIEIQKADEK